MSRHVDYYYTLSSPWSCMGHDRFRALANKYGATIAYRPTDFGIVFPATGGLPVKQRSPQRQAYRLMELRRWSKQLGFDGFHVEPKFFPVPDALAGCLCIAAREQGTDIGDLSGAIMRAVWFEERDIADADTLRAIADAQGLDGAALVDAAKSDAIVSMRKAQSEAAIESGVFGAPTYAIGDELFWGQDRLDFVERALAS